MEQENGEVVETDAGQAPETETETGGDAWETKARRNAKEAQALRERLRAAEAKLAEREDAGKSESEKLNDRVTRAEQQLAEALAAADELRVKAMRTEAAARAGLPAKFADRLRGGNADELLADAESILAELAPRGGSVRRPARPDVSDLPVTGRLDGEVANDDSPRSMAARIAARVPGSYRRRG